MTASHLESVAHEHVFLGEAHDENARRTRWVVALTATMMVGEIIAGSLFNSMALLADGVHMATHAGALAVAALAYAFARRHARNRRFSFGTGKVGDLAGFASALVLGLVAIGIAVESVERMIAPRPVAFLEATVVAAIGLAVNVVSALLLGGGHSHGHGHSHDHDDEHDHPHAHDAHGDAHHDADHHGHGHEHGHPHGGAHHDNNLRAAFVHVLADALTSVLAIVALLTGRYMGWVWMDSVMGVVGATVIAIWSWTLLRDTGAVLLDTTDPRLEAQVRAEVGDAVGTQVEVVRDAQINDLHLWRVGPGAHALILSVTGGVDAKALRARLAHVPGLAHITVETA